LDTVELHDLTLEQIMQVRGVEKRAAYALRKEARAEVNSSGASESLKAKILATVRSRGPMNDLEDLRFAISPTTATMRDISAAVWALQKQDLVTFYERKHGRDSVITKIKIPRGASTRSHHTSKGRHPVGRDMTDPRNHEAQTTGGTIEKIPYTAPLPTVSKHLSDTQHIRPERVYPVLWFIEEHKDVRVVDIQHGLGVSSGRATTLVRRAEILGWIKKHRVSPSKLLLELTPLGRSVIYEEDERPKKQAEVIESHAEAIPDTHTQYPSDIGLPSDMTPDEAYMAGVSDGEKTDDLADFPLIEAVLAKTEKFDRYEQAAALLLDDEPQIATALLESIQLTDLEKEIIRFVGRSR
jgi:DNA-binding MarR family transcriptional regulator